MQTTLAQRAKTYGSKALRARNRRDFLLGLPPDPRVLDVGCGSDSPYLFKQVRPDITYVGLDVADYDQSHNPADYADEYLVVPVDAFLATIQQRPDQFDAVVSSHNLEHCASPDDTLIAMTRALRSGGRIYLAFPAAQTVYMPSRQGTLNFYDDPTHVSPPDYERVMEILQSEGIEIDFAAERHRPPAVVAIGLVSEPMSRIRKKIMRGTWALWGFETVIWGTKH